MSTQLGTLPGDAARLRLLARGVVAAEPGRCVQCGICEYNCPIGIDIRRYSRDGLPVADSRCILCGACVARCPRGTLRLEPEPPARPERRAAPEGAP
ncbi:MAG TPA: 4Fe-4S dicluster domain-containing protein [Gemmatimonadaceae bacterium]|nr:4Fe-4S dicluster domain-containing protein [Gemmatimonadaceae bacterium]